MQRQLGVKYFRLVRGAVPGVNLLHEALWFAHRSANASAGVAVTPLVGLGGLPVPTIAQDQTRTLRLCFDTNPFDVALEASGVGLQIMFDLEHLADLHEKFSYASRLPIWWAAER